MKMSGVLLFFSLSCFAAEPDLQVLQDRVARNPSDPLALYNLGTAAFKAGDFKKAGACFSTLKPFCADKKISSNQSVQVYYNAGNTEFQLKDYQAALDSFEAVLTYDPAHQKAREKRDYIKQLLEQKKQDKQKQDQQKQDQKDSGDKQDQQQDQKKQEQSKQQDGQGDKQEQQNQQEQVPQKTDQQGDRQKELLALAEKLDNQAQEQLIRQQVGMRARGGGQHEW